MRKAAPEISQLCGNKCEISGVSYHSAATGLRLDVDAAHIAAA